MAYYGNYGGQQQCQSSGGNGLAGYGGGPYAVGQPAYYAGPSYSTTSDNDFNSLPIAGYGGSYGSAGYGGYGGGYATTGGYGGAVSYAPQAAAYTSGDPYAAYAQQQQQYQSQPQQISYTQPQTTSITQQCPPGCQPVQQQQQQCPPGCQPVSQSDDLSQLAPQIEAAYEAATGQRRQPVIKRQVITVPGNPGKVQQVVRRLPTPTPDVVERVFIVKPQRDVVNLVIERPGTPPAQYRDRTIMGKQRRPLINPRIVRVAARSQITQYQPQQSSYNYSQCQQAPQYTQQVQALPAPSPALNVQTVRVPPSSYQYQQAPQQCPPGCQPALSQQYQPQMSQAQLSQASQSNLQPQPCSQQHLAAPQQTQTQQQQPKGYLIAPVQYEDCSSAGGAGAPTAYGSAIAGTASPYAGVAPTPMPLAQPYTAAAGYSTGGYSAMPAYYGQNNYAMPGTLPGYGASMYGAGGYGAGAYYGRAC